MSLGNLRGWLEKKLEVIINSKRNAIEAEEYEKAEYWQKQQKTILGQILDIDKKEEEEEE